MMDDMQSLSLRMQETIGESAAVASDCDPSSLPGSVPGVPCACCLPHLRCLL